jgi:hypothetical protein
MARRKETISVSNNNVQIVRFRLQKLFRLLIFIGEWKLFMGTAGRSTFRRWISRLHHDETSDIKAYWFNH